MDEGNPLSRPEGGREDPWTWAFRFVSQEQQDWGRAIHALGALPLSCLVQPAARLPQQQPGPSG